MTGGAILEICRQTPILSARKTRKRLNVKISLCEPTSKGCVVKLLCRKTICFSKSVEMHDIVIGLVINIWEFGFVYIQINNFRAWPGKLTTGLGGVTLATYENGKVYRGIGLSNNIIGTYENGTIYRWGMINTAIGEYKNGSIYQWGFLKTPIGSYANDTVYRGSSKVWNKLEHCSCKKEHDKKASKEA